MSRVLVVWEDRFHEPLDRCLRRAIRHVAPEGAPGLALFFDHASGNGGFLPTLRRDWARIC